MEHLQIAYDLGVILIGFAALSMAGFWVLKTRTEYLRDFFIVYSLFTAVLAVTVLKKYLSLNVENYSGLWWYAISGIEQVFNFAVIVAAINFFLGVYQVHSRKVIILVSLLLMLACDVLIFSPIGAVLNADQRTIHIGPGFQAASIWYFTSFSFMIVLGYGLLRRVWPTDERDFTLGLLIFATVGYVETSINFLQVLRSTEFIRSAERDFLYSSIPYALYGIFLINYFLQYSIPVEIGMDGLSENFIAKYGVTDREREIILKVMQGKSNADIAAELFISLATVKTHLHNIYKKIGVESRFDLLAKVRSGQ